METIPLIDYAWVVVFFDTAIENGQHRKTFPDTLASAELNFAFAAAEVQLHIDLESSLD